MGRDRWHVIEEESGVLMVARRLPVRFDLAVATVLPGATSRRRLARLVRQDLWRALQRLRGFAPAVRIESAGAALRVTAGGQVDGALPRAMIERRIAALLEDPEKRARWMRSAR
ncbi:hypothetical protein [uncultured Roseovarius sp.]|uniref:hypothetical protein n=1 Tax=uncultured Roseovarius sp. TaxID=293344 RepID=UPI0026291DDF|nr:hypothetical protein [uncultured Roseovarius sp.]